MYSSSELRNGTDAAIGSCQEAMQHYAGAWHTLARNKLENNGFGLGCVVDSTISFSAMQRSVKESRGRAIMIATTMFWLTDRRSTRITSRHLESIG
eukprot:5360345-Amphidinium_carterae.1